MTTSSHRLHDIDGIYFEPMMVTLGLMFLKVSLHNPCNMDTNNEIKIRSHKRLVFRFIWVHSVVPYHSLLMKKMSNLSVL